METAEVVVVGAGIMGVSTACVKVHRFMADTIPGARHVVIPGVGHLTNLEAPDAFNRAAARFLEDPRRTG